MAQMVMSRKPCAAQQQKLLLRELHFLVTEAFGTQSLPNQLTQQPEAFAIVFPCILWHSLSFCTTTGIQI